MSSPMTLRRSVTGRRVLALAIILSALPVCPARAQSETSALGSLRQSMSVDVLTNPFLGGVATDPLTPEPIQLSLVDAIKRALEHNLGVLLQQQNVRTAEGVRWRALSELLPTVSGKVGESRQKISLEAFGFTGFAGVPPLIGPFNVFDARVYLTQPIVDLSATYDAKAGNALLHAEQQNLKSARDLVVLVAANLYLRTIAAQSRIEATRAQSDTAQALHRTAVDLKDAGLSPGIDVLRAQVQVQTQRQRLTAAENDLEKQKLQLARAIGLPLGQRFDLTDRVPYSALPEMSMDDAFQRAYSTRADYQAAKARFDAARALRQAASNERLPALVVDADYGAIGQTFEGAKGTFSVVANVRMPIFDAKRVQARIAETDAAMKQRESELADFKARIDYEVRAAFLDLKAADEQVETTQSAVTLANEELKQARDRFAAGVTSNIEVVQAQESVANATESYISSLYAHNLAKASLARALGVAEEAVGTFLGGAR
jgi:outer membrane protein TolC